MPLQSTYHGSTVQELRDVTPSRRIIGMLAYRVAVFDHRGDIRIEGDTLILGGWTQIYRAEITSIEHDFWPEYPRTTASGIRRQTPTLGICRRRGAPIIIKVADATYVLVIGFQWLLGRTRNREWTEALQMWWRKELGSIYWII